MRSEFQNMFSLEGPDGSGKTTQIPLIRAELENRGFEVKVLKSPDTTPLGEFIRENVRNLEPWLRNNLFLLDINYTLKQNNSSSRTVVLLWDRYVDSFYTSNKEMTLEESTELVKDLPKPVMTFLLDIDPEYIFSERQATLDHHSDPEWLEQKVQRYRELASLESERFLVIDARLPKEEITRLIVDAIEKMMRKEDE